MQSSSHFFMISMFKISIPCEIPCRYVVEPYRKYPNLLEVLLNFLKAEQAPGIRREVNTLGSS